MGGPWVQRAGTAGIDTLHLFFTVIFKLYIDISR